MASHLNILSTPKAGKNATQAGKQFNKFKIFDMKKITTSLRGLALSVAVIAQISNKNFADSFSIVIHPKYYRLSGIHRKIFGENYRREWTTAVKLIIIRISRINGGLSLQRHIGGMETKSIRLVNCDNGIKGILMASYSHHSNNC